MRVTVRNSIIASSLLLLVVVAGFLLIGVLFAGGAYADHGGTHIVTCSGIGDAAHAACNFCDIFVVIHNIFNFLALIIAPLLVIVMFIVGGLILMFGGGSSTLLERGKSIIKGTLIGLVIILISWVVINTTINLLTGSDAVPEGFPWPWHSPSCG